MVIFFSLSFKINSSKFSVPSSFSTSRTLDGPSRIPRFWNFVNAHILIYIFFGMLYQICEITIDAFHVPPRKMVSVRSNGAVIFKLSIVSTKYIFVKTHVSTKHVEHPI